MIKHQVHSTSTIETNVEIGKSTVVWENCLIRSKSVIGNHVMIGRNVFIDHDVKIGDGVRIQNNSLIYFPTIIESKVFIGPSVILTNDKFPRVGELGTRSTHNSEWEITQIHIKQGASLGAAVICIGPSVIGEWAMIAAGSVLVGNAVPFGLYKGSPAKRVGWVGHSGYTLKAHLKINNYICPKSGRIYREDYPECLNEVI